MAYADYEFYKNVFYGGVLTEDNFRPLAERASEYIDYITLGRAVKNAELPQVKKCCCALAELYQITERAKAAASSEEGELKSETVGGWSQSFTTGADYATEYEGQLLKTARVYLEATGLLYRGGRCKCKRECSPIL